MLHGDEVPVTGIGKIWCHQALAFSWASLIAHGLGGTVDDISIYIWGCFEKFIVPTIDETLGTMGTFFRVMRWGFEAMYRGRWPTHDWRGIPQLGPPVSLIASLTCVLLYIFPLGISLTCAI